MNSCPYGERPWGETISHDTVFTRPANRPLLMGIVNVTPDSFSDGGKFFDPSQAVSHALELYADGADILDIGGESTRPGAMAVAVEEEIRRVKSVATELRRQKVNCAISIDTRKSLVAAEVLANQAADIINDVSGLEFDPALGEVIASSGAKLVIMHSRGLPENMQNPENLNYRDVLGEVYEFLQRKIEMVLQLGIKSSQIIVDPGLGFGKTFEQNMCLVRECERFKSLGVPILYGHSRKSFIGRILNNNDPMRRDFGTLGMSIFLADQQMDILRIHEVKMFCETMRSLDQCRNMNGAK